MSTAKNKIKNYFRIRSRKTNTLIQWLLSIDFVLGLAIVILGTISLISLRRSEPDLDIATLLPWFTPLLHTLLAVAIIILIAIASILVYGSVSNYMDGDTNGNLVNNFSPLQGAAKDHEQTIIYLLKSVAQPLPCKTTFNTARVGQFMRALAELGYIDANLDGKYWKPWVEDVTGFAGDTTGHVNAAYKKATIQDEKVADLCKQLKQIVGK